MPDRAFQQWRCLFDPGQRFHALEQASSKPVGSRARSCRSAGPTTALHDLPGGAGDALLRDPGGEHERYRGGDPDPGQQLLHGVRAQPAAIEVEQRPQAAAAVASLSACPAPLIARSRDCGCALEPPVAQMQHPVGAPAAASASWVTSSTARPCSWASAREQRDDLPRALAVEVRRRLVGEDQLRLPGERAGDRDPLALAAGELLGGSRGARSAMPTRSSQPIACSRASPEPHPAEQQLRGGVLDGGHARHQVRALGDQPDLSEPVVRAPRARRARRGHAPHS